jgi:hypothetical protein
MWIGSGLAHGAGTKTALVRETVVDGGSIYLSDLLPKSAPSRVRLAAQEILVGQSPRPGSIRVLTGEGVSRVLDDQEALLAELDVPAQMIVRRSGRLVTRDEVTEAIQSSLRHNEDLSSIVISPESIRFAAAVLVSTADADLRVSRIEVDEPLHQLNFWLVSRADAAILPFLVTARPQPDPSESSGSEEYSSALQMGASGKSGRRSSDLFKQHSTRTSERAATIVEAGKTAQLHLISGKTTEMFLAAIALERGALGQHIRVRLETTGRVLEAQVVGAGQLEAEF